MNRVDEDKMQAAVDELAGTVIQLEVLRGMIDDKASPMAKSIWDTTNRLRRVIQNIGGMIG